MFSNLTASGVNLVDSFASAMQRLQVPAVPDYRGAVEQGWEPGSYISSKEAEGLEKTTSDAMHGDQHEPAPEKK